MWSDRYNYYNIQFDERFSQRLDKAIVVEAMLELNLFVQTSHQCFRNASHYPWVEIVLVETEDGSFASSEEENLSVTLIAIVCSKGQDIDQQIYIDAFIHIAKKLNWRFYLEADDDEIGRAHV